VTHFISRRVRAGHRLEGARGKPVRSAMGMCGECVGSW